MQHASEFICAGIRILVLCCEAGWYFVQREEELVDCGVMHEVNR